MSSPSPPPSTFGDQLLCPVCFEMFEGRILQCSQGHSVCERCHKQLHNECPQCRGGFMGTRNYILEEMIKQLKHLKMSTLAKVGEASTSKQASGPKSGTDNDNYESKLTDAIVKLVASIPKPPQKSSADDNESEKNDAIVRIVPNLSVQIIPQSSQPPRTLQPRGKFFCRMMNCTVKLPICRIMNHLRCFHKENITDHRLMENDDEFIMHYTFKCEKFRQAIHVSQFGVFFMIVNVKLVSGQTVITAWIQCVGRGNECKLFKFNLQMRIGNDIADYTDYSYGDSSDAEYIEQKEQCLVYRTNWTPKRIREIAVDVKVTRTTGERVGRRRAVTTISPITE